MWVIVRSENEYDQYGEYFEAVYLVKPTFKQLKSLLELDDATTGKLTRGGGRSKYLENTWYNLIEIQEGVLYKGCN
jgi:hypothetical protein